MFTTMRSGPDSKHDMSSMPWRYFYQLSLCSVGTWSLTLFFCLMYSVAVAMHGGEAAAARQLVLSNPVAFQPLAITCVGSYVFLAEGHQLYGGSLLAGYTLNLEPLLASNSSWRALSGASCGQGESDCMDLFLLEQDGLAVVETRVNGNRIPDVPTRRWPIGASLGTSLTTITSVCEDCGAMSRDALALCRDRSARGPTQWALFGTTLGGQVVLLCPVSGELRPLHTAFDLPPSLVDDRDGPRWRDTPSLHVGEDGWSFLYRPSDGALTQLWSWSSSEEVRGAWKLPARRWAQGVCDRKGEFLLSAERNGQLELWQIAVPFRGGDGWTTLDLVDTSVRMPRWLPFAPE